MDNSQSITVVDQPGKLREYIRSEAIMARFKEVLGDYQASAYVSSVILAVANSQVLQECTPRSIVSSALRAASLRLSCDPSTGQAYLVPFANHGVKNATLIVGYKGLYHMALRTGKYRDINVSAVYEGEVISEDRMTGMHRFEGGRTSDRVAGWLGYFEMVTGFRKSVYMTVEEIHAHARKNSRGYNRSDSAWKTDTAMMEKKTVLRLMLTHWGYFDPHDSMALESLESDNAGIELLPESVTVEPVDTIKNATLGETLSMLGYDDESIDASISRYEKVEPKPAATEKPPLRVAEQPAPVDNVKTSNTTPTANGNGNARPMSPEALKKAIAKKAGAHQNETISAGARGLMVGQLNALFGGDENKRHQFTKYLTGYGSTKDMPANVCQSIMDWMLDDEMAKREANSVIAYLDGQNGQMTLA